MRKLVWFAVGFAAAAAVFSYFLADSWLPWLAVGAGALGALCWRFSSRVRGIAVVLLGLCVGFVYCHGYDTLHLSVLRQYDGVTDYITLEAADSPFDTGYGWAVDGVVKLQGQNARVRLYFDQPCQIEPGDTVKTNARIRYTPYGGQEKSTYHKGEGILLLCYSQSDMTVVPGSRTQFRYFPVRLRHQISQRLDALFDGDCAAFAQALLLGKDEQLSFADDIALQKTGVRHVVAVSGLHVSILMTLLFWITGRRKALLLLIGLPVLLLFAAVTGFTPSVTRACTMHALVIMAVILDREFDSATAVACSVVILLTANPLTVTAVSFQLSTGCMVGMLWLSPRIYTYLMDKKGLGRFPLNGWQGFLVRWLTGSLTASLSTMAVTLPMCAIYFDMVSVIGILSNLLTLWLFSFIFCGLLLSCLLSWVWMPLGAAVAALVSGCIQLVRFVVSLLSTIPFGVAYTSSVYTVIWLVSVYFLILLFRIAKKKNVPLLVGGWIALYALSMLATWAEPRLDSMRMTVVDVGQGQCIILQNGDEVYMVDCGGQNPNITATKAMQWLHGQGVYSLDGLIITHYDEDHCNAAANLLQIVPVERLYLPLGHGDDPLRRQLANSNCPITWVEDTYTLAWGSGVCRLYPSQSENVANESSMCILFQAETCDILITGDREFAGEAQLLAQAEIPDLEILVAGHHGAKTSTGRELLEQTKQQIVVISAGEDNLNGHPHRELLSRLLGSGCEIRRTDLEGTIIIRR